MGGALGASWGALGLTGPHAHCGQYSSCLRAWCSAANQPAFQDANDGICNLAAQSPLQSFAFPGVLEALLRRAEVGRSAHPLVELDACSSGQPHHPPELLSIKQPSAGDAAPKHRSTVHRSPASTSVVASSESASFEA